MYGLYIVGFMVLAGAVALVAFYHKKSLKMTSNTAAEVVRVQQREVRDDRERRDETIVTFRYTVAGKDYRIEEVVRGRQAARYPEGKKIRVYYNPETPEMSRIDLR